MAQDLRQLWPLIRYLILLQVSSVDGSKHGSIVGHHYFKSVYATIPVVYTNYSTETDLLGD